MIPTLIAKGDRVSLVQGQIIAQRYRIDRELGEGAQARVFQVRDLELDEDIALKVLTRRCVDARNDATGQFKQEIRLARRIVHANVCRTHDFGRWNDLQFVTMELINGDTLASRIKTGSFTDLDERLTIFRDVLIGVRAAHAMGIVHRDIKPLNVMVTAEGRVVVMDFGLAGEQDKIATSSEGAILGTPAYIAPERFLGESAGFSSDIYSLGILLYEVTTGQLPFQGGLHQLIHQHLRSKPPRLRDLNPSLPESMDQAVARMLAKNPAERYPSVDQVLQVLAEIYATEAGPTVLLAEGDRDLRALIAHHLSAQGLQVRTAEDGEETIELLLRERPDLVVLDLEMPKIDGLRIAEMIRYQEHAADTPIYLLSRLMDSSYRAYARQLRIRRLVKRPFSVRDLAREIREYLQESCNGSRQVHPGGRCSGCRSASADRGFLQHRGHNPRRCQYQHRYRYQRPRSQPLSPRPTSGTV